MQTVQQVIANLGLNSTLPELSAPDYIGSSSYGIGLAVESMKDHMSNEGWQLFEGLEYNGYTLFGHNIHDSITNIRHAVLKSNPGIVLMQDKREWDATGRRRDFRDPNARFTHVDYLKQRPDIFKLTILKDAHQQPEYHCQSAQEIDCNAWVIYYHPAIVKHLAPYVRSEHLIRTYHSIDPQSVPPFNPDRQNLALISGAIGKYYPLRTTLARKLRWIPSLRHLKHPGYHRNGTNTPTYLEHLRQYKVSICTSSVFGYSLRKLVESIASGCIVITDLPVDDVMPVFDETLVRISPHNSLAEIRDLIHDCYRKWEPEKQKHYAEETIKFYDYRETTCRLADDIENLRRSYKKEQLCPRESLLPG